jgi:hypothetical protein
MQTAAFASLVFCLPLHRVRREAQNLPDVDKPMWTMEFIKVKPGMFGLALG